MAYWDPTPVTPVNPTEVRKVLEVSIRGDLDENFTVVATVEKVRLEDGVPVKAVSFPPVVIDYNTAFANPALEPHITKIKNGCRGLIRALKNAD